MDIKGKALKIGTDMLNAEVAEKSWNAIRVELCGGVEPTDGALATLTVDDMKGAGVVTALARAWVVLFQAKGEIEPMTEFDPKRARRYTAAALVEFYVATPDEPALLAEISRRTGGEPWVVAVEQKVHQAESAQYISWLANGDEPPTTREVDGVPVTPVQPGEEKVAREHAEDPSAPGERLAVDGKSKVTGADFTGVSHEARQVLAVAFRHDLRGASKVEVRRAAREAVGKSAVDLLRVYQDAALVWSRMKPEQRPTLKIVEAPVVSGFLAAVAGNAPTTAITSTSVSSSPDLRALFNAAIDAGLSRNSLLAGIDRVLVSQLQNDAKDHASQMWLDINNVSQIGGDAWRTWLLNAQTFTRGRREELVFRAALELIQGPPALPPLIFAISNGHRAWASMAVHLAPQRRMGRMRFETDVDVSPGESIDVRRRRLIRESAVVVVLISAAFLADDEIDQAIRYAISLNKRIVPIRVGACRLHGTPLEGKTMLPRDDSRHASTDEDFAKVAAEICAIVNDLTSA